MGIKEGERMEKREGQSTSDFPNWQHKGLGTLRTKRMGIRAAANGSISLQRRAALPTTLAGSAQPSFGYPVYGVEVMPLHTVPIPGRYFVTWRR